MTEHRTLARVRAASLTAAAHQVKLRDAIKAAHVEGHSLRAIAEAAGLSHQRIHQIVREAPGK
jgi:hypothetical protein